MSEPATARAPFGAYLKDRRGRLDPTALGLSGERRRTSGLRREEVALRANISPTWYTCLEQGRGGAPSPDVLERIARALMLTGVEREHLFMLGIGRPAEVRYNPHAGVAPRLQHVLDALDPTPALLRTATWDVIGWNKAATAILPPYAAMPASERNMLRHVFLNPLARAVRSDWDSVARAVVAEFRADAARAGALAEIEAQSVTYASPVRRFGRCGTTTTYVRQERWLSRSTTRFWDQSLSKYRSSPWTAGLISR